MDPVKNSTQDDKTQIDGTVEGTYDKIDIEELAALELTEEEQQMFNELDSDLGFQVEVETLMATIGTTEVTKTQSQLLLLLYQFFK